MALRLSLNTNPLVNRFAEVDDLMDTLADKIGIGYVQLTPEFIHPSWPASTITKRVRQFQKAMDRTGIRITSVMTSTYARLNHMGHPMRTCATITSNGSARSPISPAISAPTAWARNSRSSPRRTITTRPAARR